MEMFDNRVMRPRWVEQGELHHNTETQLWKRRNLSRFGLQDGTHYHNFSMHSQRLGLHGIADMIVETNTSVFAVEFKLSAHNKKRGDILQACAYAMLAQEHFNKPAPAVFLVGKNKILYTINIDDQKMQEVLHIASAIRRMMDQGRKPDSSATMAQCCNCEYLNHCNDR